MDENNVDESNLTGVDSLFSDGGQAAMLATAMLHPALQVVTEACSSGSADTGRPSAQALACSYRHATTILLGSLRDKGTAEQVEEVLSAASEGVLFSSMHDVRILFSQVLSLMSSLTTSATVRGIEGSTVQRVLFAMNMTNGDPSKLEKALSDMGVGIVDRTKEVPQVGVPPQPVANAPGTYL